MKPPVWDDGWSDEVKAVFQHDMQEIWDKSIQPHIWNQYHNQIDICLDVVRRRARGGSKLRILDVGCAQGTLALLLAESGHDVLAIDLRQQFLDYAKTRHTHGHIRFCKANVLDFETDERFDVIFANQLVEHLVYPLQMLRRLRILLRSNGLLVATTPNWEYAANRLPSFTQLGDVAQFEEKQFSADGDGHFFAYREEELVSLFNEAGFAQARSRFFESPFISGHMKIRYVHRYAPASLLRFLDRAALSIPVFGRRLAHQLMVVGANA